MLLTYGTAQTMPARVVDKRGAPLFHDLFHYARGMAKPRKLNLDAAPAGAECAGADHC
jgi:hypothetical protein